MNDGGSRGDGSSPPAFSSFPNQPDKPPRPAPARSDRLQKARARPADNPPRLDRTQARPAAPRSSPRTSRSEPRTPRSWARHRSTPARQAIADSEEEAGILRPHLIGATRVGHAQPKPCGELHRKHRGAHRGQKAKIRLRRPERRPCRSPSRHISLSSRRPHRLDINQLCDIIRLCQS